MGKKEQEVIEVDDDDDDDENSNMIKEDEGHPDSDNEIDQDDDEDPLKEFYEQVSEIKRDLGQIRINIETLDEHFSRHLSDGTTPENNEEAEKLLQQTNSLANSIRNALKSMKAVNTEFEGKDQDAEARIRINIHQTLTKKFLDLMQQYQELQTNYKKNYRSKMQRQIEIVSPGRTQEEIDQIIDNGDVSQVLQSRILDNRKEHNEAVSALIHIKEQHRDILQLEQSIIELHQIFVDMASLVEAQGEMIDQIEYNVEQACAWTGEAVKELKKANVYQKKARKKCCCICAACTACAGAAAGAIALGLAPLAACTVM